VIDYNHKQENEMVNKDNIDLTINSIKGEIEATKNLGFNMDVFHGFSQYSSDKSGRYCETVACIAGHAYNSIFGEPITAGLESTIVNVFNLVKELGISEKQSYELFYGEIGDSKVIDIKSIRPEHAIAVLENLKETGEVDWSIIPDLAVHYYGE
jgi:hypothetical protein